MPCTSKVSFECIKHTIFNLNDSIFPKELKTKKIYIRNMKIISRGDKLNLSFREGKNSVVVYSFLLDSNCNKTNKGMSVILH